MNFKIEKHFERFTPISDASVVEHTRLVGK